MDLSGPLFQYGGTGLADRIVRQFMVEMFSILEGTALPRMRDAIPVRTGRLRDSLVLRLARRDNEIVLGFTAKGFYWHMVDGLAKRLEDIFADLVGQAIQPALDRALAKVLP